MASKPHMGFAGLPEPLQPGNLPAVSPIAKRPWRCPICGGCGTVEGNFYTRLGYGTDTNRVECRACYGRGIVLA